MGLSYDEAGVRKGVDLNIACDAHFTGSDARPASRSWLPKLAIGEEARTIPYGYVVNHPVNLTDPLGPIAFYWHRSRSGRVGPRKLRQVISHNGKPCPLILRGALPARSMRCGWSQSEQCLEHC